MKKSRNLEFPKLAQVWPRPPLTQCKEQGNGRKLQIRGLLQKSWELLRQSNIFKYRKTMNTSVGKLQAIEGLSKRELSKLEKLMKREEINKTKSDAKSYKRKAGKSTHPLEPQPTKLLNTEYTHNDPISEDKSISAASVPKVQARPTPIVPIKKAIIPLRPFNSEFSVEGGEDGLFIYLMSYVMAQKQRQLSIDFDNLQFLDTLEGTQLEIVSPLQLNTSNNMEITKKVQEKKAQIKEPFDKNHKDLLRGLAKLAK